MKVLVLGDSGMLGHMVGCYLSEAGHDVLGASRRGQELFPNVLLDIANEDGLSDLLEAGDFDMVVNCVALLGDHVSCSEEDLMKVNGRFPHRLAGLCAGLRTRVVQISTDGVFAGDCAPYAVFDTPDVLSAYGRSKVAGELDDGRNLTVRACPFGPDLRADGVGLFNWFMHAEPPVTGWTRALFTGVTTLALAQFIERAGEVGLAGVVQFAPREPISKAALLHELDDRFRKGWSANVQDVPGTAIDRSLVPTHVAPSYSQMLDDLRCWMCDHEDVYGGDLRH